MRTYNFKAIIKAALQIVCMFPFAAVAAFGQSVTATTNFGSVAVGATSTPQTVTLTAGASADTFTFAFSPSFSQGATLGTCVSGAQLAASSTCTINVAFSPSAIGAIGGSLTIAAASGTPVVGSPVALGGTGYEPTVTATATPLDFGQVPVNVASTSQLVTVSNTIPAGTTGGTNLDTLSFSFSSTTFTTTTGGTCGTSLAVGNSCTVAVVFTPTAVGALSGQKMTVTALSNGSPVTVSGSPLAVRGTGYEPTVGTQLMGKVVTLTNQSNYQLTFTLSLGSSTVFTMASGGSCSYIPGTTTTTILKSGSCTINVASLTPSTTTESAQLTVTTTSLTPVLPSTVTIGETATTSTGNTTDTGLEQQINLTAAPTSITLPDGNTVPMWGYSCGTAIATSGATCAKLNPNAAGWSPVVITVPSGQDLEIELTNNLSFANGNTVPTSIVIVGQVGGGLGSARTTTPSPTHNSQGVTWPTANTGAAFVPPPQGARVQSFATEVAAGTTADLVWKKPRPGTYLIESGTHPSIQGPMGLYGILVVTSAPSGTTAGTAYSAGGTGLPVTYNAEIPLEFSEIDPVQNTAVQAAVNTVGFSETEVWTLSPGVTAGPVTSIAVNSGGTFYTLAPVVTISGSGSNATAVATIAGGVVTGITITDAGDGYCTAASSTCPTPTVVTITTAAGDTTGSGAAATATVTLGGCGGGAHTCYPPAVNYTPLYYAINGVAFDKTNAAGSLFPVSPGTFTPAASTTGSVLVRLVNAGLRMHVPSIVGSQVAGATGATNPVVTGFMVIAEDGNPLPGIPRVKSDVFMAAGKTFDVMINGQSTSGTSIAPYASALPLYDRELSLSGNAVNRDSGMLAYISINGAGLPAAATAGTGGTGTGVFAPPVARPDTYTALVAGQTLSVSDPSKGVIANDTNVYGVKLLAAALNGTVTLNANGTFTYVPNSGSTATSDSFTYCANGTVTGTTCSSGITAMVTLGASNIVDSGITCTATTFYANIATYLAIKTPGVLAGCKDAANLPLTVATSTVTATGMTVVPDANGGFNATAPGAGTYTFSFQAQNSQKTLSAATTVTVTFPAGSGLTVNVLDGQDKTTTISDYRWVIEEDRTFYIDPNCQTNPPAAGCPSVASGIVPTLGANFHTSYMPYVAQGCTGAVSCEAGQMIVNPATGAHSPAVCDVGNGVCRPDTTGNGLTAVLPGAVALDKTKRYYISVLPGDAANPFTYGYSGAGCQSGAANAPSGATCGHGMGGAPIAPGQTAVTVITQPAPYPPAKLSVFVFEDDFPLNGEQDGGGGVDVLSPQEPGLGGFQIHLWDAMGGNGDFTGQMTYDMFNQPLTNSLAGTVDPNNGNDACPVGATAFSSRTGLTPGTTTLDPTQTGITGMIVTCPKYESDGKTLSPLAGQAVIANLMPGRWGAIASPGADRIARGEEWLQTNTLDGQKAHDVFTRIGEPSYFQEFGPASYHVSIGFANPAIINDRHKYVCNGTDSNITGANCNNTLTGKVTGEHLSRTPDERLYSTGSHDTYYWSQCYVSFGDVDGEDFAFTKCNADGTFTLTGLPDGNWRVTVFDQWNDLLVDGLSTPIALSKGAPSATNHTTNMGEVASTQWQTNLYTQTFIDDDKSGVSKDHAVGIPFANVAVRLRDGSLENLLVTDFTGTANFNETFPLFSWYTVETDVTRYKNTGTHVVYDVGGPVDGSGANCTTAGYPPCGNSTIGKNLANTAEIVSVPANLRVPGSVYCAGADCSGKSIQLGPGTSDPPSVCTTSTGTPPQTTCSTQLSSGRIDSPWTGGVEGWQGFPGQNSFLEFGKEPYAAGENGGIKGHVVYASTRPFDDPQLLVQTQWEPLVPHVTINLYQEGFAADNVTPTLTLVDTTATSSFDDYAQGFHRDANGNTVPNMSCPGQGANSGAIPDLFYFSLYNQPNYLDFYNSQHGGPALTPLPNNSQFKCYDGMHNWNQLQPAPYDGAYQFPSVTSLDPTTGKPASTNCKICSANHAADSKDLYYGLPMLPAGKYVVEVVLPQGYELVKEEDKNILIGDSYIAPVTQEFGGLGNIFILPDQASVAGTVFGVGSGYNANNAQNPTQSFGATPENGIVPAFIPEPVWPCVGEARIVPDYISLYPQSHQVAPFAGATRNLCDRKEVTLGDQMGAIAKFYIYTSTHIASKFTGGITDDYTSEFDPFSPQFGEKFAPPNLPVSVKDWAGNEISRVYADHWGSYDGMTYSTWEVNPPNPTGYSPTMMVFCMNDPGPIPGPGGTLITDPQYTVGYSQFCYELPFMPGTTQYLDTPVVPTSAFAGAGYNNVDCAYPNATPAVSEVDGDQVGPWVSAPLSTLKITALGNQTVPNNAYSGPAATTAPFNQKTITRHYGFGAQCLSPTAGSATCSTVSSVTIGGVNAPITGWSDTSITVTVPPNVPYCAVQQQAQYGGSTAQCGELVITAGNGRQSIDSVTVTIGGKAPTHVAASATIQGAIDAAAPGDLIIVDPTCPAACTNDVVTITAGVATTSNTTAAHNELLLMWKPVRLQGVGAASSIINANTHPAGKLDVWREYVNCLFGLSLNGTPISPTNKFDPTGAISCPGNGWNYFGETSANAQVDPIPTEAVIGWDASQNGNLAQLLQEPSLMGALEGAGITVLSKGANFLTGFTAAGAAEGAFPTGTTLLTGPVTAGGIYMTGDANALCHTSSTNSTNPFPSNFQCNPSSIDGLGITESSQGGGGIFVHAWGHNLQIANNRIQSNAGTLSGGINVGQGEFAPQYIQGATNLAPGSCVTSGVTTGAQLPYCENIGLNIHHNYISLNSSTGDELFSATPAGAGGVSICTGADYYKFKYNWVCGNLSSGDGGGVGHMGFTYNGDIESNSILFNQSLNPTIPANGGGLVVMGTPDVDNTCGVTTDQDCVSAPATVGPSDGVGPGLIINANLIMGNAAEAGSGGGLRLQGVNGSDVIAFPTKPSQWYSPTVTNNIIADNVAGWDGAGISLVDALNVNIINNTVVSNSTTASAGILFTTIGYPLSSSEGTNCVTSPTTSCPQISGLVSIQNSTVLRANLPATITCPGGHYIPGNGPGSGASNGVCRNFSYPLLENNIFWQNSAYYIGVGALSAQYQQNVISLYTAFTTALAPSQTATGQCTTASYWDIGVRGDTGPHDHSSGVTLFPRQSILTDVTGYNSNGNDANNPAFISQYCDGSRTPPEFAASGWSVPAGISDATVPNPIFNLAPVATVDEGNNWVNMRWGPLSMSNPVTNATLGNYGLTPSSAAIDSIPTTAGTYADAPPTDFFGNKRPDISGTPIDVGAVEFQRAGTNALAQLIPSSLTFGNQLVGTNSAAQTVTLTNIGGAALILNTFTISAQYNLGPATTCTTGTILTAGQNCIFRVMFGPTATGSQAGTLSVTTTPGGTSTVTLTGTGIAPVLTLSPTSLTFNSPLNVKSAAQTVTVSNTGTAPLTINSFNGLGSGQFAQTNNCPIGAATPLAVGASCTVNVTFTPTSASTPKTATLNVNVAAPATTPGTVALTGNVRQAIVAFSGPTPALSTTIGTLTTKNGVITVSNTGTGPLTLTAPPSIAKASGTGTGTASIQPGGTCISGAVIPAATGTCTINVRWAPTNILTANLAVTLTDSGAATGTQTSATFPAN